MKRILFLLLTLFAADWAQAQTPIEIYVDGHKYNSFQDYQASKKKVFKQSIPKRAQANILSDSTQHKLYVMSVEHGVVSALEGFYQNQGSPVFKLDPNIASDQLQEAIQQAVTASKGPKLIISQPGKLRIMAMTTDESQK